MKVYVVLCCVDYLGSDVEAVFSSEKKAESYCAKKKHRRGYQWTVEEWEIDAKELLK